MSHDTLPRRVTSAGHRIHGVCVRAWVARSLSHAQHSNVLHYVIARDLCQTVVLGIVVYRTFLYRDSELSILQIYFILLPYIECSHPAKYIYL